MKEFIGPYFKVKHCIYQQMEEAEAFILLRHLMFRRGLRKQYLPDMSALQVQVTIIITSCHGGIIIG